MYRGYSSNQYDNLSNSITIMTESKVQAQMFLLVGLMEFVLLKWAPTLPKKITKTVCKSVGWQQYENIFKEPQHSWMFMVHLMDKSY